MTENARVGSVGLYTKIVATQGPSRQFAGACGVTRSNSRRFVQCALVIDVSEYDGPTQTV